MEADSVVGVTSNPTIFEKALSTGDWYDEQLRAELEQSDDTKEVFFALAVEDVRRACDLLWPIWERTEGVDGFVSIEVDPDLAYDREASFAQAKELSELVDRGNVYVKIPGTAPGLGAIEDSIAAGRPINVTLIFSLARHAEVVEAYIGGLERLVASGRRPDQRRLGGELLRLARRHGGGSAPRRGRAPRPAGQARHREREARVPALPRGVLRGALGGARGSRRAAAALPVGVDLDEEPVLPRRPLRRGARRTRHGQHDAARDDRGVPGPRHHAGHVDGRRRRARSLVDEIAAAGVDYDDVTATLEAEGVQKFSDSFASLLEGIDAKRTALV